MLAVNDSTPYNAVYGRVPRVLPSIDQIQEPNSSEEPLPGLIKDTHRLREISVQAMIEGSATARLGRAINTRTTMDARHLDPDKETASRGRRDTFAVSGATGAPTAAASFV